MLTTETVRYASGRDLALLLRVSHVTIWRWDYGDCEPSLATVKDFCSRSGLKLNGVLTALHDRQSDIQLRVAAKDGIEKYLATENVEVA